MSILTESCFFYHREIGKEEEDDEMDFGDDDDDDDNSDSNTEPAVAVDAKPSMSDQKIIGELNMHWYKYISVDILFKSVNQHWLLLNIHSVDFAFSDTLDFAPYQ